MAGWHALQYWVPVTCRAFPSRGGSWRRESSGRGWASARAHSPSLALGSLAAPEPRPGCSQLSVPPARPPARSLASVSPPSASSPSDPLDNIDRAPRRSCTPGRARELSGKVTRVPQTAHEACRAAMRAPRRLLLSAQKPTWRRSGTLEAWGSAFLYLAL